MFRVDVNQILNFHSTSSRARARNPNPFRTHIGPDNIESDEFRMFTFKVKDCPVNRAHDWTICPYSHSGERAWRRDPRRHSYVAVTCPDFRATGGLCPRAEHCPFAHGVFEYWLHPTKYRTRACNSGLACTRPVCFFAHSHDELRSEPTQELPKWATLVLLSEPDAKARARQLLINGGGGSSSGIRAQTQARPGPKMSVDSSCGTSSINNKMVQNELMEGLRRLGINKNYNNNINDKIVNMDYLETPNIDWVSDLLAN